MAQIVATYPAKQLTTLKHIPQTKAEQVSSCSMQKNMAMKKQLSCYISKVSCPHIVSLLSLNFLKVFPKTQVKYHLIPDKH